MRRILILTCSMLWIGCAQGSGCGDSSLVYPRDDAGAERTRGALRLRITEVGLNNLAAGAPGLMLQQCADISNPDCSIDPSDTSGKTVIFPLDGSDDFGAGSQLKIDTATMEGNIQASLAEEINGGGAILLTLGCKDTTVPGCEPTNPQPNIQMGIDALYYPPGGACEIEDNPYPGLEVRSLQVLVRPEVIIADNGDPVLDVGSERIEIISADWDFDISVDKVSSDPACSGLACDIACGAIELAENVASGLLNEQVLAGPLVELLVGTLFGQLGGEKLEVEGSVDLTTLLPIVNESAHPTQMLFAASTSSGAGEQASYNPTIRGTSGQLGFDLDFDAGFVAEHGPCVPTVAPPDFAIGSVPNLETVVYAPDPVTGEDVAETMDLALELSSKVLGRAAFEVFDGGSLCFNISSADMNELTSGGFSSTVGVFALLIPGLLELAPDSAPLLLRLVPQEPPVVSFGTGQASGDTIDSHIKLLWPSIILEVYPWADDSWVHAVAFKFDLNAGLSVVAGNQGNIDLMIDEPPTITNEEEVYNELIAPFEPGGFGALVSNFVPLLLEGGPISAELTADALGFPFVPKLRAVKRAGEDNDFLALYLRFCNDLAIADPTNTLCYEEPAGAGNSVSDHLWLDVVEDAGGEAGDDTALLRVHSTWQPKSAVEIAYRVDGGPYFTFRGPRADGLYAVAHPKLLRAGEHRLEVVARHKARPHRWSEPLEVVVEGANSPPWLHAKRMGEEIQVWIGDDTTAKEDLLVSASMTGVGGERSLPWAFREFLTADPAEEVRISVLDGSDQITSLVIPPFAMYAGEEGFTPPTNDLQDSLVTPPAAPSRNVGCSSLPLAPTVFWWWSLVGVLILRRGLRRRW